MQALGAVSSALASGIATTEAKASTDTKFEYKGTKIASPANEEDKVHNAMVEKLGQGSTTLSSVDGAKIWCLYNAKDNKVLVYASKDSGATAGGKALVVSN